RLQKERTATLLLQDRLAQDVATCEEVLAKIASARQGRARRFFVRDRPPVWDVEHLRQDLSNLPERVVAAGGADVQEFRRSAKDQLARIPLHGAMFAGLAVLMAAARRKIRGWSAGGGVPTSLRVFDRPVAAALVLTLLASGWVYSPPPPRAAWTFG